MDNVRIIGSTFLDIGTDYSLSADGSYVPGVIGIFGRTDEGATSAPAGNHAILIEGNRIENCPVAGIHAYAARDVVVKDNTLINTNTVRAAGHVDPVNLLVTTGPISLDGVSGAVVEQNHLIPAVVTPAVNRH